jgi:hypothetical protein
MGKGEVTKRRDRTDESYNEKQHITNETTL